MSYALFVDSANSISFEPEYDYSLDDKKFEDVHRVRSGGRYVYKWGSFNRFKFTVSFINSSDMAIVNSWWASNTELLFMNTSETAVHSVQLVNQAIPIGGFIKPYTTLFRGKIELETY